MNKILKEELIKMNTEYSEMFNKRLNNGMYFYDPKKKYENYYHDMHTKGYKNLIYTSTIPRDNFKNYAVTILGLKGADYIQACTEFNRLGVNWTDFFAEKDLIYFLNCAIISDLVEHEKIEVIVENYCKQSFFYEIMNNIRNIEFVYNCLEDIESKTSFVRCILKRIFDCPSYVDIYIPGQYLCDFLNLGNNELIIDCGAYDGDTAIVFSKYITKGGHIYAFESDNNNFNKLVANTHSIKNIDYFSIGLSNCSKSINFCNKSYGASFFSLEDKDSNVSTCKKLVIKGDYLNLHPTYIKMDIEGSEMNALKGLKNTISHHMPKLAICIYHKFDDLYSIPLYIKSNFSGYKFYVRHHSTNISETVLYAIKD